MNTKDYFKLSGISYFMIFLTGFFANFVVVEKLFASQDVSEITVALIQTKGLYVAGLLAFVLMVLFDIILIRSLYPLFVKGSQAFRYLTHGFRGLHALCFLWGLIPLFMVVNPEGKDVLEAYETFTFRWNIGLLLFGVHLLLLSVLLWRDAVPKWVSFWLSLAGIAYVLDCSRQLFDFPWLEGMSSFAMIMLVPTILGEFSFTIWLLIKGFRKG